MVDNLSMKQTVFRAYWSTCLITCRRVGGGRRQSQNNVQVSRRYRFLFVEDLLEGSTGHVYRRCGALQELPGRRRGQRSETRFSGQDEGPKTGASPPEHQGLYVYRPHLLHPITGLLSTGEGTRFSWNAWTVSINSKLININHNGN